MLLWGPDFCHGDALAGLDPVTPEVVYSAIYMFGIIIVIVILIIKAIILLYIVYYYIVCWYNNYFKMIITFIVIISSQSFTLNPWNQMYFENFIIGFLFKRQYGDKSRY